MRLIRPGSIQMKQRIQRAICDNRSHQGDQPDKAPPGFFVHTHKQTEAAEGKPNRHVVGTKIGFHGEEELALNLVPLGRFSSADIGQP